MLYSFGHHAWSIEEIYMGRNKIMTHQQYYAETDISFPFCCSNLMVTTGLGAFNVFNIIKLVQNMVLLANTLNEKATKATQL